MNQTITFETPIKEIFTQEGNDGAIEIQPVTSNTLCKENVDPITKESECMFLKDSFLYILMYNILIDSFHVIYPSIGDILVLVAYHRQHTRQPMLKLACDTNSSNQN